MNKALYFLYRFLLTGLFIGTIQLLLGILAFMMWDYRYIDLADEAQDYLWSKRKELK